MLVHDIDISNFHLISNTFFKMIPFSSVSSMDHQIGPDGKPCRACVSVEDLMKKGKELAAKKKLAEKTDASSTPDLSTSTPNVHSAKECPVDKDELGRSTWTLLHTMSVYYPENPKEEDKLRVSSFMKCLGHLYPCEYCAKDLRKDLVKDPPKVNSRTEFAEWMCLLHNKVNKKTGKHEFDCKNVFERWRDGWKDGSCDY